MKPIGVCIVGCGRISDLHVEGYRGRTDAGIVAVCDSTQAVAAAKATAWNVDKVYTDFNDVLADPAVDLVELLVPHHLHADMTIAACRARKHVSVQKPMALSAAQADAMIAAARTAGVVLRVYENFVFYPPVVEAKRLIGAGEIGEPRMVRIHYNSGARDRAWDVPLSSWVWRFDEEKCGGGPIVFDHGYHLFSLARYFLGPVAKVCAWIDHSSAAPDVKVDGPATVMLKFDGPQRYGVIDFAHTPLMRIETPYYADDNRVEIIGDRGILMINRCTAATVNLPPLLVFKDGRTRVIEVARVDWRDSFVDCTRHLLDVLRMGGNACLDGAAGKAVLQTALAVQRSALEGREIALKEME